MSKLLSMRAYAKVRGVSHEAVAKAVRVGRISTVLDEKGNRKIDPEVADREWSANSDQSKQPKPELLGEPKPDREPVAAAPDLETTQSPDVRRESKAPSTYAQSRAAREAYAARLAKLEFEQKSGKLIDAEEVKNAAFKAARTVRDQMLNIPDRVATEFAAETNAFKIHTRLTEEIKKALETLKLEG